MMTFISGRHPPPDFKSNQWEMCTCLPYPWCLHYTLFIYFILSKSSDGKLYELHIKLIILFIPGYSLRRYCWRKKMPMHEAKKSPFRQNLFLNAKTLAAKFL